MLSGLAVCVPLQIRNVTEAIIMFNRVISTGAVCLLLGAWAPAYAQQGRQSEKQGKPEQRRSGQKQRGQGRPSEAKPQERRGQPSQTPQPPAEQTRQQRPQQQVQRPDQPQGQPQRGAGQPGQPRQQRIDQTPRRQQQPQRSRQEAAAWQQRRGWLQQGAWQGHTIWQQGRARKFESEHRSWIQRGGYGGYYIPQATFRLTFGRQHWFRISSRPTFYMGYPRFAYGGYRFMILDPWPEYWMENWYETDDIFVDYDDGYYLYNRRYPDIRLAITVAM